MQPVIQMPTDEKPPTPLEPLQRWRQYLQEHDHSPGTVKKYTQAVSLFLVWYEQREFPYVSGHFTGRQYCELRHRSGS